MAIKWMEQWRDHKGRIFAYCHLFMVFVWLSLLIPTLVWWKDSVLWVAIMSLYANMVGHWSAYQGARSEERQESDQEKAKAKQE